MTVSELTGLFVELPDGKSILSQGHGVSLSYTANSYCCNEIIIKTAQVCEQMHTLRLCDF